MMPTIRSAPRNGGAFVSDEALLDEFVATALAEDVEPNLEPTPDEPKSAPPPAAVDYVEAFLQCTAAYLNTRPDRHQLLERLGALISAAPADKMPQPGDPATDGKAE
jgi:hypothetical protein